MGWYSKFKIESPSEHVNNHASVLINSFGKSQQFEAILIAAVITQT